MVKPARRRTLPEQHDLDLAVPVTEDHDVVHNRRAGAKRSRGVLPEDAHAREVNIADDAVEEALNDYREQRNDLDECDFDVPTTAIGGSVTSGAVELVQRDYEALSASEKLKIIAAESPEVSALLDEYSTQLAEVASASTQLQRSRATRATSEAARFLETKVSIAYSYCAHIAFYLLLKLEGASVDGHPVVDRLVDLRVYAEKITQLEKTFQYSLSRLFAASTETATKSELRPVATDGFAVNKSRRTKDSMRSMEKARDEAAAMEREELETFTRNSRRKQPAAESLVASDPVAHDEDQFLSSLVGQYNVGDQTSLLDALRSKVRKRPIAAADPAPEDTDGSDADYDELLAAQRDTDKGRVAAEAPSPRHDTEVERRGVNQKILQHRGLTRARPKDKKNPRVNRRDKARRGERAANAQTRSRVSDRADTFEGVSNLKPHVTHSSKMR